MFAHRGAGEQDPEVIVGGVTGGISTGFLNPHSSQSVSIEVAEGNFIGSVSVDNLTPECFNSFTVQTQYRLRRTDGSLSELFSYATPQPIKPGQCALAAVDPETDPSDGSSSIPGFASVSVGKLEGAELCHRLRDGEGEPVTPSICFPTDGSHQAQLLPEVFTDSIQSGVSSWQVCFESAPTTGASPTIWPLFIDVVMEGGVTQFDGNEHQVKTPGCTGDQFNACLGDRFRVSSAFRESPLGPSQRSRVATVTSDQYAYFYLSNLDNIELLVELVDGCPVNDHFWVFAAATTDVEYELTVVDTLRGQTKSFNKPFGAPAPALIDTSAFATCP